MRKTLPFLRLIQIVQFIRENNNANKLIWNEEISNFLVKISGDDAFVYAPATFSRDKQKIKNELGIDLKYSKVKGYFINYSDQKFLIETSLDYFEMFSVLHQANTLPDIFMISERKPNGLHLINEAILYIKKKEVIQFRYLKYDTNESQIRIIEPLTIKESRERWYLIGNDFSENKGLRAFAFDRIEEIVPTGNKFSSKYTLADIQNKYNSLFAMFDAEDQDVEEVVLQFDQRDGNYIKSFPIHHSQKVVAFENGVEVHLKLKTTPDFIMEIMSRAWSLKVIQPESLRLEIKTLLKLALDRNT